MYTIAKKIIVIFWTPRFWSVGLSSPKNNSARLSCFDHDDHRRAHSMSPLYLQWNLYRPENPYERRGSDTRQHKKKHTNIDRPDLIMWMRRKKHTTTYQTLLIWKCIYVYVCCRQYSDFIDCELFGLDGRSVIYLCQIEWHSYSKLIDWTCAHWTPRNIYICKHIRSQSFREDHQRSLGFLWCCLSPTLGVFVYVESIEIHHHKQIHIRLECI